MLGEIPINWHVVQLTDFISVTNGYSYKGAELQPSDAVLITIKNFESKGGFKIEGFKEIVTIGKTKPAQHAKQFDILVAHTDLTQNADIIGNAEMLMTLGRYKDAIISLDLVKVESIAPDLSNFILFSILKNSLFKDHALGYVNGTTVLHLDKCAIPEYKFVMPKDMTILAELNALLEPIYRKIADNMKESFQLEIFRDALLPRLMAGELYVDDHDAK